LLYDLEPSQASFALRFKSLLMTLLPASEEFLSKFPSRYLSSPGSYPLDLSGVGDPAGSNVTADLALRVTGTKKPHPTRQVADTFGGIYIFLKWHLHLLYFSKTKRVAH
jgi:hypothetical protein